MKRSELENKVRGLGFTFMHHQAMSGSQYITINGIRYRLADHEQPSHYQVRNYVSVSSYEEILEKAIEESEKDKSTIKEIDGKKYKITYIPEVDGFSHDLIK